MTQQQDTPNAGIVYVTPSHHSRRSIYHATDECSHCGETAVPKQKDDITGRDPCIYCADGDGDKTGPKGTDCPRCDADDVSHIAYHIRSGECDG